MSDLAHDAAERAARYLASVPERPVAPDPDAVARLDALETPLPGGPCDPRETLDTLEAQTGATMTMASPRFFGFVTGGSLPVATAANWLATVWDQNAAATLMSPAVSRIEQVALTWLVDALHLPAGTGAGFVTGATTANFTCLVAARHDILRRAGWDVEADGLFDAPPVTVVLGEEAHPSVFKALGMAGFGRNRVTRVLVDNQGRMRADKLPPLSGPAIVILQAGNVNSGAFDPFAEIIPWAKDTGAWIHIDGAFGLWAAASPQYAHLMRGAEDADSWATDAHKTLNVPYDSGLAFVREPETLRAALSVTAAYLSPATGRDPSDYTPELSRRGRGIEVWAALRTLGRAGLADLVDRFCRLARRFSDGMRAAGYPTLNEVVYTQALIGFGDDATTRRVIEAIQRDGTCWCGVTVWQGQTAMRVSVSNWATTDEDVDRSVAACARIARANGAAPVTG